MSTNRMGSLPAQEYRALVGSMRETALLDSKMISVTKGMRILQKKLLELWDRYRLDTPLVNMIIRFLDLPTRVFRQLELNQRYAPNLPGGLMNQIRDFPKPPVKTFPQLSQNRNRKLEKDFSRLRTQWRIFLSISRTSSRAPVLT